MSAEREEGARVSSEREHTGAMSAGREELERIAARLAELAEGLDPETSDDSDAVELAREAAELSARAASALDDAIREAGSGSEGAGDPGRYPGG